MLLNKKTTNWQNYFDFIWAMTEKEIKTRYKRAVFGFLWVILNPLLQMVIIGLIFSFFIKIPDYFLYLFSGLLLWQFFSLSLTKATASIVNERTLLQKAKFPIEAIPISIILANFFHLLISIILLLPFLLVVDKLVFPQIILIVPAIIWLLFFTMGVSLLTTSLQVKFRDMNFFIQTVLTLWFYATPVLYNLNLIPSEFYYLFAFNPLTSIFEMIHFSLHGQGMLGGQILYANLISSILIFALGIYVFRNQRKYFVDWL